MLNPCPPLARMCASTGMPASRYLLEQLNRRHGAAGIVRRGDEECRRRRLWQRRRHGQRSRVHEDRKVGPSAHAIDRIGRSRVALTTGECHESGELAARRKSHDANARGINVPLRGAASYQPQRTVRVFARVTLDRIRRSLFARQSIFQRECGNAEARQELRGIAAFRVEDQQPVAAAGNDDDGGAAGFLGRWQEHRDGRVVDVLDPVVFGVLGFLAPASDPGAPFGHSDSRSSVDCAATIVRVDTAASSRTTRLLMCMRDILVGPAAPVNRRQAGSPFTMYNADGVG